MLPKFGVESSNVRYKLFGISVVQVSHRSREHHNVSWRQATSEDELPHESRTCGGEATRPKPVPHWRSPPRLHLRSLASRAGFPVRDLVSLAAQTSIIDGGVDPAWVLGCACV